ncbi:MAG TPA: protein kinase, partial [Candidatus Xenobia bacterium]
MENIGRFQLLRMLGAGGLSVVYEARDSRFGGRVALKVLRPADLTPMEIARFSREYEVLAKLSHRNLVQVYEYGLDGRRPYFTMELLEGTTLASLTCAEDLPAENLWGERNSFIFGILFSLLDAMEHLHRRGILHRDIKPGNIMLSPAGVKLMDFGLARDASAEAMLTAPGMIMGTLRYCSPEQCTSNAPIDPRADLYAFGVVLYELMVGRPPFSGDGWPVIQQILSDPVPPPSEFNPRLPEAYGALIMRLLEKKPDDRPQTVAEVRIWLSHLARSSGVDPPPREVARYIAPAGMQATCERFLSSVGAGHNGFLLVSGEEGMGKTRLADELETLALARRIKVVRTAGQGGGGSFHAVEPIVRAICGGMSTEELIGRFGDGADGLVNLPQAGHPIFPVVSKVVRYAAHTQPLVLIVDDMHWADYDSFELLSYIVRDQAYRPALGGHGVGVAWTCVAEAEPGLRERMSRLTSGHVHAAFVLPPLLPPDVVDLLVSKLGDEAAATDLAPLLHRATRGNPSFILECLQRLIETAVLVERGGRWFPHPNWDAVGELVESSLSEAFGRQLHGLSEAGIDILSLASLVGTSFSIHVLVACVGSTEVQTAVDELVATGVVRVVPGRRRGQYAFSSARLRRYVVTTMSYAQREALERQILLGLEEAWQAGDRRVLHPLALHSKDLGDLERALHYGLLAAESAASAGANQRAADLYEAAMKMPGFEARLTAGLRDALFDVMMAAGRYGTAEQLALESAQAETERSRQAHWRHRVGRAMMGLGKTEEALPHFSASLEGLGAKAPTWGTKLKGIFDLPSRVRLPQRDQDMVRAINSARQVSDADTRALLQASYALLLVMTSKPPVALIRN